MRSKRSLAHGLLAALLSVSVLAGTASALEVGQKAPEFTLPSADGKLR